MKIQSRWGWRGVFEFFIDDGEAIRYHNEITPEGVQHVLNMMVGDEARAFDTITLENEAGTETASKTIIPEVLTGKLRSTVLFDHTEANFHIKRAQLWADTVKIAETPVDIQKTNSQSLTVVRSDTLEGETG